MHMFHSLSPRVCTLIRVLLILTILGVIVSRLIINGTLDQDVEGKIMVVHNMEDTWFTKRQGLFAEVFAVLGALHYAETRNALAVRVQFTSADYVDPGRGPNWWAYFFEDVMVIKQDEETSYLAAQGGAAGGGHQAAGGISERAEAILRRAVTSAEEVHFNKYLARFGVFGSFARVLEKNKLEHAPFPLHSPGALTRREIHNIYRKYIRVLPAIEDEVTAFLGQHTTRDTFLIGVHYRGTDKVNNWPYRIPSFQTFIDLIQLTIAQYHAEASYKIFIATDDRDFLHKARELYGSRVFFLESAPRANSADKKSTGVHKSSEFDPYDKGHSAVIDWLVLSRTNFLIKNRSGLSDTAIIKNITLPYALVMADDLIWSTSLKRADIQYIE